MFDKLNKIKSMTFEEIISSEIVMDLLSLYSFCYLNNSAPLTCVNCMRNYYTQLLKEGEQRIKLIMEAKKRTLIPNWEGLRYIRGAFYDSQTITDEQAINSIKEGYLRESHFKKLPDGLIKPIEKIQQEEIKPIEPVQKKKGRKAKK